MHNNDLPARLGCNSFSMSRTWRISRAISNNRTWTVKGFRSKPMV